MGLSSLSSDNIIPSQLASALSAVDASQREGEQKMYLTLSGGSLAPLSDQNIEFLRKSGQSVEKLSTPQIVAVAKMALTSLGSSKGPDQEKALIGLRIAEHTYEIAHRDKVTADKVGKRENFFNSINTPQQAKALIAQATKMRGKPLTDKEYRILENFLKQNPKGSLKTYMEILKYYDSISPEGLRKFIESLGMKGFEDDIQQDRLQNGHQRSPTKKELGLRDYLQEAHAERSAELFKKDCVTRHEPFVIRVQVQGEWKEIHYTSDKLTRHPSENRALRPEEREEIILKGLDEHLGSKEDVESWAPSIKVLMTQFLKASSLVSPTAVCVVPTEEGPLLTKITPFPPVFTINKAKNESGEDRITSIDYSGKWMGSPALNNKPLGERAVTGEFAFTLTMPKEGATISGLQNRLRA